MIPYAAIVMVMTPQGLIAVRDLSKPMPVYWKLPGGRNIFGETVEQCAARELKEETGIIIKPEDLKMISQQEKGSHVKVFFQARVDSVKGLKSIGDEGEEVKIFPFSDVLKLIEKGEFHPAHSRIVGRLWKKYCRR